jgi:hypothetical protein
MFIAYVVVTLLVSSKRPDRGTGILAVGRLVSSLPINQARRPVAPQARSLCCPGKQPSAPFGRGRHAERLRRRGRRRYVLFDQVPEHCREQEGDQLRAPVCQDQSLHNCCAIKFPRCAGEMFPE